MPRFNFSPGPSALPAPVLEEVQAELLDFAATGRSVMELSHRSAEYESVHTSAQRRLRRLFDLPDDFAVLLLQGGATLQFSMVPLNLVGVGDRAAHVRTGAWGAKAFADARAVADAYLAWDGEPAGFTDVPDDEDIVLTDHTAYLHVTSNETIGGVQFRQFPRVGAPLVADMSSDIASRSVDWRHFGLVYAGAQKNLGPAGVTVVMARRDLLRGEPAGLGAYLHYGTHLAKDSLYNTPPVFSIYVLDKVLGWIEARGGLTMMEKLAQAKSALVYREIDESEGFYQSPVAESARSRMNVVFRLPDDEITGAFLAEAEQRQLHGLKGHRSVGGVRVSLYNAVPLEGAEAVAELMQEFRANR